MFQAQLGNAFCNITRNLIVTSPLFLFGVMRWFTCTEIYMPLGHALCAPSQAIRVELRSFIMIPTVAMPMHTMDAPSIGLYQQAKSVAMNAWDTVSLWHERNKTITHMQSMNDHLLHDIGLERGDIPAAVKGRL